MRRDEQLQLAHEFLSTLSTPDESAVRSVVADEMVWSFPGLSVISGEAHGVAGVMVRARMIAAHNVHIEIGRAVYGIAAWQYFYTIPARTTVASWTSIWRLSLRSATARSDGWIRFYQTCRWSKHFSAEISSASRLNVPGAPNLAWLNLQMKGNVMKESRSALLAIIAAIAASLFGLPKALAADPETSPSLTESTITELRGLYKQLIDAENRHDIAAVRPLLWVSPNMLFVAKTATAAEGNWAGFWGTEVVLNHLNDLYKAGPFKIDPDYDEEKVVALSRDVAQTYVPVSITVAYAGQTPVPKPFLMIIEWVRTPDGWRMATDIALPIPPAPQP